MEVILDAGQLSEDEDEEPWVVVVEKDLKAALKRCEPILILHLHKLLDLVVVRFVANLYIFVRLMTQEKKLVLVQLLLGLPLSQTCISFFGPDDDDIKDILFESFEIELPQGMFD